ncbi:MAG: hypothetical protein RBU29_04870 [bacterium]|nr:hypothetical protein [bacterium]
MIEASGEVIYTSTTEITGQSLPGSPPFPFGSFGIAGVPEGCACVVYHVETTSLDPHRRPTALGLPEEQIAQKYPHLAQLLKNQFQAILIGEWHAQQFVYGLPATPPPMHAHVRLCTQEEIQRISQQPGFLRYLHDCGKSAPEELLLTVCRAMIRAHNHQRAEFVRIGKALSDLYRDDYDTLRRLITRLETGYDA